MSKEKLVAETLTIPSEMPLFNYHIKFDGLRQVIENVNIQANDNSASIERLRKELILKATEEKVLHQQKMLDQSLKLGPMSDKMAHDFERSKTAVTKQHKDMNNLERYCWKVARMSELIENILSRTATVEDKISDDDRKHQKAISQSSRRLDDKINGSSDTLTKTINCYFGETNQKVSSLSSDLSKFQINLDNKLADFHRELNHHVSESALAGAMEASEIKIKNELKNLIETDQMKRLSNLNDFENKLKQSEKDMDLKIKALKQKVQEVSDKIAKTYTVAAFEVEKHKIFEKLTESKTNIEDLLRKNGEFVDYRQNAMMTTEKMKQEVIGVGDEVKKMQSVGASNKQSESLGAALGSIDPHSICRLENQTRLHGQEIGKLEQQFLALQKELVAAKKGFKGDVPDVNVNKTNQLIHKTIKEYMNNMDFQNRVKKCEGEVHELNRKSGQLQEIEKKMYQLTKEMNMEAIMKEIRKKSDEENTRKDFRILDGKIDQLFEFFKQMRRDMDDSSKKNRTSATNFENYSLTTKKLYSSNCLSCLPSSSKKYNPKMDFTDEIDHNKSTVYSKVRK